LLRRIRLVLWLPLLLFLLQLFLCGVMSDCATGRGAQHGMMTGHVTRYGAYRRTFDATFRHGGLRANPSRWRAVTDRTTFILRRKRASAPEAAITAYAPTVGAWPVRAAELWAG
jgi:hypothetical protein